MELYEYWHPGDTTAQENVSVVTAETVLTVLIVSVRSNSISYYKTRAKPGAALQTPLVS